MDSEGIVTAGGALGDPCVGLAFARNERLRECGFRCKTPSLHIPGLLGEVLYLTLSCLLSYLFPGSGSLTT